MRLRKSSNVLPMGKSRHESRDFSGLIHGISTKSYGAPHTLVDNIPAKFHRDLIKTL